MADKHGGFSRLKKINNLGKCSMRRLDVFNMYVRPEDSTQALVSNYECSHIFIRKHKYGINL